jgi:oligopeptidase B
VRIDDWYWLRDKDDPAVIEHLKAENAYTESVMDGTAELRQALFEEMVARIEETDLTVPVRKGPWLYYGRTVEGSSYGIHCRRPVPPSGPDESSMDDPVGPVEGEQVLLDENVLAAGHDYFSVGNLSVSPDHRWLVYSTDTSGGERYTMRFTDLAADAADAADASAGTGGSAGSGGSADESIEDTSYGVAWANDNATVFYVRVDEAMRPYQLWRHRVGTDPATDNLVYEEPDDHYYLGVGRTKDDRFILLGLDSKVTSEFRALPADEPEGQFTVIEPRRQGVEYSVDHDRGDPSEGRSGRFLIVTNDGSPRLRRW